jgi:hypothetical protein
MSISWFLLIISAFMTILSLIAARNEVIKREIEFYQSGWTYAALIFFIAFLLSIGAIVLSLL